MSETTRDRLVRLLRRPDADLGEAALLCCAEHDPELDVDVATLRLDALADRLSSSGFLPGRPEDDARRLGAYLAVDLGFSGDTGPSGDPDNALLTRVLDRRRGLPVTLSILYAAIARRVGVTTFLITLPGHVVAAVPAPQRAIIVDPSHHGQLLDERTIARRVQERSAGHASFHRAMLRPAAPVDVVRRLLDDLTRDFQTVRDVRGALWTVELKLRLPNHRPEDQRILGDLLVQVGRFDAAATAYERYLELTDGRADDDHDVRRAAIRARARLN